MVIWDLLKRFEKYLKDPKMILRVHFYRVKWLPYGAMAMTLGHWVLIRHDVVGRALAWTVAHELRHVEQVEWHGFFRFYWRYLRMHFRVGYIHNSFEIVARAFSEYVMLIEFPISEIK